MSAAKELLKELIEAQPDDASLDEIIREIIFERMVAQGIDDVRNGRVLADEELARRIQDW